MAEEQLAVRRRRRTGWRLVLIGIVLVVLLVIALLWVQRRQIATDFIDRELERRGVQASYRVAGIGLRTQRLEKLVIGDPRRPDLTADWVEVEVAIGLLSPRVEMVRARGVRIRGRIVEGKLVLGEVDKLLPPPTGAPFRLPEQSVDIADTAMVLDTPAGRVGLAIEGKGGLSDGFRGALAASAPKLTLAGCTVAGARAHIGLGVTKRRPSIDGPVQAERMLCGEGGAEIVRPRLGLDLVMSEALDSWIGETSLKAQQARLGATRLASLGGTIGFTGDKALTRGRIALSSGEARTAGVRAAGLGFEGSYAYSGEKNGFSLLGDAKGRGLVADGAALRPVTQALTAAEGSPAGPLGAALADALGRAGQRFDAQGALRLVNGPAGGAMRLEKLDMASASGAKLVVADESRLTYYWPLGRAKLDGDISLSGGGFPETRANLSQAAAGAPIRGEAWVAPFSAGGARLQLAPIRFTGGARGTTRIETIALLDGPFKDGRVEGLQVPIRASLGEGGFAVGEACTPVSVRRFQAAGLTLGQTRLPLCPTGRALIWSTGGALQGGAEIRAPRLAGRLGESPISLAADRVRLDVAKPGFTSANLAIRLGAADSVSSLDLATLEGAFSAEGVSGRFSGGAGKLASVPLLMSGAEGRWSVLGGDVVVDGVTSVADEADEPRFYPLVSRNFHLTLRDSEIAATGLLEHPETGTGVATVKIAHSLRTGTGQALLDVPGLRFDDNFQPERLTRLTTGVVALVNGTVTGGGEIGWGPDGVSSTGSFSTRGMNLAANFGPVTNLATTIHFTDLLGLETAPEQLATVGQIQAGIDVFDGEVRYQLLPDLKVKVESGRWPFAGGQLALEETILDFSRPAEKHLTFRVTGLDAGHFIQQFEFSNISATGTFDGVVPMIFDDRGGRIVGGSIVAREGGGTLSYIGELTDKELGTYGKLAFDALKSLRYDKLDIGLDGALDGEFVTTIQLDGIARNTGPQPGLMGGIIKRLAALRFEFNITAKGPFRALLATTRSLGDPTLLIQTVLPEAIRDMPTATTVQPKESETVQ